MEACGICLQAIKADDLWVKKASGMISNDFGGYEKGKYHAECYRVRRKRNWIIGGIIFAIMIIIMIVMVVVVTIVIKNNIH